MCSLLPAAVLAAATVVMMTRMRDLPERRTLLPGKIPVPSRWLLVSGTEWGQSYGHGTLTFTNGAADLDACGRKWPLTYEYAESDGPQAIDFHLEHSRPLLGIYALEGDQLRLCFPSPAF